MGFSNPVSLAFVLTVTVLVSCRAALTSKEGEHLPPCNYMTDDTVPKYHLDSTCDRLLHNSLKKRGLRASRYEKLLMQGIQHIPDELTFVCPETVDETSLQSVDFGHDTKWIVENSSSGPVVLTYVEKGIEYSALSSTTPPQDDKRSTLQPGEWTAIDTFEGHLFYVRELLQNGGLGRILLVHRPGLVPLNNKHGGELKCDPASLKPRKLPKNVPSQEELDKMTPAKASEVIDRALEQIDPQPKVTVVQKKEKKEEISQEDMPEYARSDTHFAERCNIIYKGFRNNVGNCPLHVYYTGMQGPNVGKMQCREEFKFHLGLNHQPADYMHDWHSRYKFEASFVDHTFVARLADKPDVVVDTYTMQPTMVTDCPELKKQQVLSMQKNEGVEVLAGTGELQNVTANGINVHGNWSKTVAGGVSRDV